MNPILHQWKWDFRRIRLAWILWIALLVLATAFRHYALTGTDTHSSFMIMSTGMEMIVIYLLGSLLVAFSVFTTPFSGSTVFWKTRPLASRSLFWEKTLLILTLVWLPVLLSRCIQYLLIDPDPSILTGVALTYAPLTLGIYLLAATWTAICSNLRNLTLGLAGTVGFAMLLGLLAAFVHRGSSRALIEFGSGNINATWPTLVTALFLTATLLLVAWIFGAFLRRPTAAAIMTGLSILVLVSQNNLWTIQRDSDSLIPRQIVNLEVLDQDQEPGSSHKVLYPQLAVPLPSTHLLSPTEIRTKLIRTSDRQDLAGAIYGGYIGSRPIQLLSHYPADTKIISDSHSDSVLLGPHPGHDPVTFFGSYQGMIFDGTPLGSLRLVPGASNVFRGYGRVRLDKFKLSGSELAFLISSVSRKRNDDMQRHLPVTANENLLGILRHSETGTLIAPRKSRNRNTGGFNLSIKSESVSVEKSDLQTVLGRPPSLDDLGEFEIDLYSLTPVAHATGTFKKDNWIPFSHRPGDINDPSSTDDAWTKAVLPDTPTNEQVNTYLDTIITRFPRELRNGDQKILQSKFNALGSTHLDRLIARLPVHHYVRHYSFNTIRKHATRDHLPALLAAFERDPAVAGIIVWKRWQQDAVAIAREHLRASGPFSSGDTTALVAIATKAPDPAINDDLFHHFVLTDGGHSNMIKSLRQQPGFPIDEAIARAWARERSGLASNSRDLAYHAIRLGDPEALRRTIAHLSGLANANHPEHKRKRALLDEAVDQPAGTDALAWAHSHFAQLQFDPDRKVFTLPE